MRIDPQFASAVTFLTVAGEPDAQRNAPALPVGTAFLVGEPLGDTGKTAPWLVTARHVIDNTRAHETLYFRVAKDDGTSSTMSAPHGRWVRHPSSDVAMVRIQLGFETQQLKWIPLQLLVDETAEADGTIAVGDETFMLTVLPQNPGSDRDRPIARFGHISKLATEPVLLSGGPNYPPVTLARSFLVEATTWPTNSGAPVFVHFPQGVNVDGSEERITIGQAGPRLLGLCAGHYGVGARVQFGEDEGAINFNSGISVVTPASTILEITKRPEHIQWRNEEIARLNRSTDR